jgi:hypothetical protein
MKGTEDTRQIDRYIALDIHKEYVLAGGQNAKQAWVLPPHRINMAKFREWASANLGEGDVVVIETTTNVWDIYDTVAPLATRTVVAHAGAVRQIAEALLLGKVRIAFTELKVRDVGIDLFIPADRQTLE